MDWPLALSLLRNSMNKRSFSLIELIVAATILSLTVGGLLYVVTTEKVVVSRTGRKVQATEAARGILENLKNEVRADQWPGASGEPLEEGLEKFIGLTPGTELTKFSGQRKYIVNSVDADAAFDSDGDANPSNDRDYKSVTVTVWWIEP